MIPASITDQQYLAEKVQKLVVFELAKKGFTEATKEIKEDIKDKLGQDVVKSIPALVKAGVDAQGVITDLEEKLEVAEEGKAGVEILSKYFKGDLYLQAEEYLG